MQVVTKGMRATQLYMPNNPVYQRAVDNIRGAFRQIWQATDDLIFDIGETEMRWEDHVIYSQDQRNESIAWTLYKDGVRSLTFKHGVEDVEIVRFLGVLHQAKNLQADAPDDLLTLLWAEDFQFINYTFRELASENAVPIERDEGARIAAGAGAGGGEAGGPGTVDPSTIRRQVAEEAPPKREGLVSIDDFDTTLYFLDDKEVEYLHKEIEREYGQDLRRNVLAMLFDLLELQTYGTVRAELISIVENFIPYLLGAGDFRAVAYILRETKVILQRARELIPEHRQTLESLPGRLSQGDALSQLLQSLDEATGHPSEADLTELFTELRAEALATLMGWLPRLSNDRVRELVKSAAERLALANAGEVLKALASEDAAVQLEMVRLAGRLKLPGAPDGMGPLLERGDRDLKLAVVEALTTIGSPSAMRLLEKAVDDADRDVRIAGVKFLGQRGHRNAFPRIEAMVTGNKLKDADLTEKMAFFEAYGALAGTNGIPVLEKILVVKGGLLSRKEDPETRACAAMALGKIRVPAAREVLQKVAQDKEALVRNAVSRALRDVGGAG
ncbi:MAG TPA: HEAT repeat domain-containing protein [Gemmatimonadales bacterium]|jgi:HEAT repeat protein|nr:HEAT repeat domain-containing protein [Gemmatimonadales bacterium]